MEKPWTFVFARAVGPHTRIVQEVSHSRCGALLEGEVGEGRVDLLQSERVVSLSSATVNIIFNSIGSHEIH